MWLFFTGKKENASLARYVSANRFSGGLLALNLQKSTTRLPPLSKTSAALIGSAATQMCSGCLQAKFAVRKAARCA